MLPATRLALSIWIVMNTTEELKFAILSHIGLNRYMSFSSTACVVHSVLKIPPLFTGDAPSDEF